MYYWGLPLASLASAALILAALHRGGLWERLLSAPPLVWLGRISYGLYLWHGLAFAATAWLLRDVPLRWSVAKLLPNLAAVAVAAASFYLIEQPFLRLKGRLGRPAAPTAP
jgi:peptidoglycan/LPS O-acetylase OafA/YrhL